MSARAMSNSKTLQDVVFAVHFVGSPMTIADFGSWIETFKEPGVDVHQAPPLQPIQWAPESNAQAIAINFGGFMLPRVFLRSEATNEYYLLQEDRFAFGWHRQDPVGFDSPYPGYETLKERWVQVLEKFEQWQNTRSESALSYKIVELSYQNALPLTGNNTNRRVPDYFQLSNIADRNIREFQFAWRESVSDPDVGYVDALATIGTVPPAKAIFQFNFTGIAPVATHELRVAGTHNSTSSPFSGTLAPRSPLALCDVIHNKITDMYAAAINEGAL